MKRFGLERGEKVREEVLSRGLKLTLENFNRFSDLPSLGWGRKTREIFCPFAEVWISKGAEKLCKIYCDVDIWKLIGYNSNIKARRVKWVLEGDEYCEYEMEE